MQKNRNDLRAGIFIILSVCATVALAVTIRGLDAFTVPTEMRYVKFSLTDDVGGLRVGDDVRIGGFKVGEVRSITVFEPPKAGEQPFIRVAYSLPRKYVLHEDAVLRIQGTLTGLSWLNFESLGGGGPIAVADADLRGQRSEASELLSELSDMRQPLKQAVNNVRDITQVVHEQTLPKVQTALDHASDVAVDVRAQIEPAFKKYHAMGDHAITMMDKIAAFFGDTTSDFRTTLANLSKLTGAFNAKVPNMLDRVNGILVNLDTSLKSANGALEDMKATLSNTKDLTGSARSVLVGNKGKLEEMIASLKETGDNLKNASAEIRRSPWRLLYKPAPGEMANLNLYDAARQFSDGAAEMNDAALALRDAANDKNADKAQIQKLMEKLDKSYENFSRVEQTLWEKAKE